MKSNLENFAELVAVSVYGLKDQSELTPDVLGVDWENAVKLIEAIGQVVMEIINNCPDKRNLSDSLVKPSWLQRVRFRSAVKNVIESSGQTKLRSMSGKIADVCLQLASQSDKDVVNNVIDEVSNPENMVI